jgi:MFS family permease
MTPVTITRAAGTTLLAVSMMVALTVAGLSAAMPSIAAHFADVDDVAYLSRLVLVAPSLVIALSSPVMGYIVDRFGRTKLLLAAVVMYGVVGGAGFFAEEIETLILLRVLLGVAAAGVNTAVTTLTGDYFAGVDRQHFLGFRTGLSNLTNIGINICSGLLAAISWRMPFLMYFSVLLLVPFIVLTMPEPARLPVRTDIKANPVIWPIGFLAALYTASFLHNTTFYLIPVQLPFYLNALGVGDPRFGGVALAMTSLGLAAGSIAYARIRRLFGSPEAVFAVAFSVIAVGMAGSALASSALAAVLSLTFAGLGFGITFVNFSLWVIDRAPPEIRGRAVGGLMTSTFLGHFAAPFWSQIAADRFGIASIYACGAVITAALAVTYLLARPKSHRSVVAR